MPLLKINADGSRPVPHGPGDLIEELRSSLAALPDGAPVMILVHGFRYSPYSTQTDPHRLIFALKPEDGCRPALSWPRNLGFGRGAGDEGLCIAFGWEARGTIWRAWNASAGASAALASLITVVTTLRPGAVDLLCHSLGARVGLTAMAALPAGSVGRMVLMAAAEYRGTAQAALATPAGASAEIVNVTSRENDLFDAAIESLIRPLAPGDRALGAGLARGAANWLDLQMDCAETIEVLRDLGYAIPPPSRRICHWSAYARPGILRFYRDMIRDRDLMPLARLADLLPDRPAPRWSRLLQLPEPPFRYGRAAPRSLGDLLAAPGRNGPGRFAIRFPAFRSRI